MRNFWGLVLFQVLSVLIVSGVQAQERGKVLRDLISRAEKMRYTVSFADSLYPEPVKSVLVRDLGENVILRFDYALLDSQQEWFANIRGESKIASELFEQALLPKQPTRAQSYFLKQIEALLYDSRDFVLEFKEEGGVIQSVRALLSLQMSRPGEQMAFFPPRNIRAPNLIRIGSESEFWPLVVVEFPSFLSPVTFQYSVITVPLSSGRYTGDLRWINTRQLEAQMQRQEGDKLEVEIRPASAQIFRTLESDDMTKENLEIEAKSSRISVFASWFVPLWLALYPNAKSLRVKKNLTSSLSVLVDIDPYRGMSCGPFLSQK